MEGALPLIALVAVVVSAGVITVAAHFRQERVAELRGWAREHDWDYVEQHPSPLADVTLPEELRAPGVRARHVLTGRRGRHLVTLFELDRPSGRGGDGPAPRPHRIVAVRAPGPGAELEIHRRDLSRTVSFDGRGEPEEIDRAFAGAFRTSGDDERFARAVLTRGTVAWLLSDCRSRSLPVRFSGGHVLTWAPMRLDPARALTAADYLIDLVDRIPGRAWELDTAGS